MTIFPLPLSTLLGHWGAYVVFLAIGFAFGYVLEIAGFGNSKKLADQFYFKDLTVLKVMFGAIIVAMVLIFTASAMGLLDYNLIWVNPTYLWPGIIGGLIMGFGFIIGGFCPGTSLVAAATAKLDGIFFVLGVLFGIFLFGETVDYFPIFWNSSYLGRFTLPEWLGLSTGTVVLLVVLMALFMFWGGEKLEQAFGKKDPKDEPKWRYYAAGGLIAVSSVNPQLKTVGTALLQKKRRSWPNVPFKSIPASCWTRFTTRHLKQSCWMYVTRSITTCSIFWIRAMFRWSKFPTRTSSPNYILNRPMPYL